MSFVNFFQSCFHYFSLLSSFKPGIAVNSLKLKSSTVAPLALASSITCNSSSPVITYDLNRIDILCPSLVRHRGIAFRPLGMVMRHKGIALRPLGIIVRHKGIALRPLGIIMRHKGITFRPLGIIVRHKGIALRPLGIVMRHRGIAFRPLGIVMRHKGIALRPLGIVMRHKGIALQAKKDIPEGRNVKSAMNRNTLSICKPNTIVIYWLIVGRGFIQHFQIT
ncbi:hypothetical protein [Candidatus Electrothrix sp.]|uniref:hypothetical protein n=1 Tax=Candidatus Electrothrix sp. TaxID=2170559 RepID=UPI004055FDEE